MSVHFITSFGKANLKKLREFFGFKNITQAIHHFKVKTEAEALFKMASIYNKAVEQTQSANQKAKKETKKNQRDLVKGFSNLPMLAAETTKKSQEERQKSRLIAHSRKTDIYTNNLERFDADNYNFFILNIPHSPTTLSELDIERGQHIQEHQLKTVRLYYYDVFEYNDILKAIKSVYDKQRNSFKINIAFGYVFEIMNAEGGYQYHVGNPYRNPSFFVFEKTIQNRSQLRSLMNEMDMDKIAEFISSQRPDTKTKVIGIYSVFLKVFPLDYHIGAPEKLPAYITANQNIWSMKDAIHNSCFWQCYAYHLTKNRDSKKRAKEEFKKFYGKDLDESYFGFDINNLDEMQRFEETEQVNVDIWDMNHLQTLEIVRRSPNLFENTMNLLLYGKHFSYITKLDTLTKVYKCCSDGCGQSFDRLSDLKRHMKSCEVFRQEDKFPKYPQIYEPKRNLVIELNEMFETHCDFRFPYLVTYDFESLLLKMDKRITENMVVKNMQQAVSCSIYSNIPNFEQEICIVHHDVNEILRQMFVHFSEIAEAAYKLMLEQMKDLFAAIEKVGDGKLDHKLEDYCAQLPIIGFNSGSYDINLNFEEFIKEIFKSDQNPSVVKSGNRFKCIRTSTFLFLDECMYLPPQYNLDQFVKAFDKGGLKKSVFPYEFLDSYEKLDYDINLLTRDDFYSSLKSKSISDEDWEEFNQNKVKYEWTTIKDLLIYYNNLDVKPFLEAVVNQKKFFYDLGLDMHKDGMSLPALSEKIMFSYEFKDFNENYIHQKLKPNMYANIFNNIGDKLKGYRAQDKKSGKFDKTKFIGEAEVKQVIQNHNGKCHYCWRRLVETSTEDENKVWTLDSQYISRP